MTSGISYFQETQTRSRCMEFDGLDGFALKCDIQCLYDGMKRFETFKLSNVDFSILEHVMILHDESMKKYFFRFFGRKSRNPVVN